jgi:uncharacterized protein
MSGLDEILALNTAHESETSPLNRAELCEMLGNAFHSACEGAGRDGFLIAFDQDGSYDSVNFLWFKARFERFVYVDRIIIAPHARGRGLARTCYEGLFDRARAARHSRVVCEINLEPPNPGSIAFHAALGFTEIGRGMLGGGKVVSYQEMRL